MITDVLYIVNLYIPFCVKRFELIYVRYTALYKCYVLLLLLLLLLLLKLNHSSGHNTVNSSQVKNSSVTKTAQYLQFT